MNTADWIEKQPNKPKKPQTNNLLNKDNDKNQLHTKMCPNPTLKTQLSKHQKKHKNQTNTKARL
jgi:hypothetical protein